MGGMQTGDAYGGMRRGHAEGKGASPAATGYLTVINAIMLESDAQLSTKCLYVFIGLHQYVIAARP